MDDWFLERALMSQQDADSSVSCDEVLHNFGVGFMLACDSVIAVLVDIIIFDIWPRWGQYNSFLILKDIVSYDPQLRWVDNIDADVWTIRDRILQQNSMMWIRPSNCYIAFYVMTDIVLLNNCVAVLHN